VSAEKTSHPVHPVILSNLIPANVFIIHHRNDFTPILERQKTYRRLFGMIFFGGSEPMVVAARQWLATQKISKNGKNSKANSIFIFQNIDLAAKTPQKRPVFSVSTNLACADSFLRCCGSVDCIGYWKLRFLSAERSVGRDGSPSRPRTPRRGVPSSCGRSSTVG